MSDKKKDINCDLSCRMNKVGGQAVLEGVMMKSGDLCALSVRADGEIKTETSSFVSLRRKHKILNIPVIRGVVNMIEMFRLSFSTLSRSAEMIGVEEEEPGKFEKWLTDKFGDKLMSVVMGFAGILGVALALLLFMYLPMLITSLLGGIVNLGGFKTLIEGVIKIAIFIAYMALVALMPDIKRTFEYHGAEHKSIACYEKGLEMTPENAKTCTRFHPRCGTSFIFVVLIISIVVFSLPIIPWDNLLLRLGLKLLFLPVVIGLSFEFIMYAGKHDNTFTRVLSAPGLAMQKITTKEPDLEQLEVAIASLKAALPDEFPPENISEDGAADENPDCRDNEAQTAFDSEENPDVPSSGDAPDASGSGDEGEEK